MADTQDTDPRMYAVHPVKSESDVIRKIGEAYRWLDEETPLFLKFDEDGGLVQIVNHKQEINDYLTLMRFANMKLLRVQIYEDREAQNPIKEGMMVHDCFVKMGD